MATDVDNQIADDSDLISEKAEIFRNKLILDFHLLDMISETGGKLEPPKYYTSDLLSKSNVKEVLKTAGQSLVRFQVYSNKSEKQDFDPRENRIKTRSSRFPPLDLWAHWIIESSFFQNMILCLILMNSIVLGIQGELSGSTSPSAERTKFVLEIFDYIAMVIYSVEIFLKWIDNFWDFWKSRWNIFDFVITFLFFIPEFINMVSGNWGKDNSASHLSVIANNLRTFRILRSLKMVSRFQKVRLIVLAVTKAFQAMVFITVLLLVFAYIFAILGVMFFKDSYKEYLNKNGDKSLKYTDSFSSLGNALITLFQLFTLDHWMQVYKDIMAVSTTKWISGMYIIFWIIIGSFIFRNIFVGIMVNNFQSIRNDLFEEVGDIQEKEQRNTEIKHFAEEINRMQSQEDLPTEALKRERSNTFALPANTMQTPVSWRRRSSAVRRNSIMTPGYGGEVHLGKDIGASLQQPPATKPIKSHQKVNVASMNELHQTLRAKPDLNKMLSAEWEDMLERNMYNLKKEESCFAWPKDTMFRYLIIMENLQENLKEREEILNLIEQCLLEIHDTS